MKINVEEFKNNLNLKVLPEMLEKFIEFQNEYGFETYSECFGLYIDEKEGLKSWSKNSEFLDKLYPIAQANGTGSFYAIWKMNNQLELEKNPIILFGDEGGAHVVASNLKELLILASYDSEPCVDEEGIEFYRDEDYYTQSPNYNEFIEFLKINFGITAINNADEANDIVENSQEKFGKLWEKFLGKYC